MVRLGASTAVVAEPQKSDGDDHTAARMMGGTSTISCVCIDSATPACKIQITTEGESTVNLKCVSDGCTTSCSKWIIDKAGWDGLRFGAKL